jgi:hypothetical protein
MKLSQVQAAANAERAYSDAKGYKRDLKGYHVVLATIARAPGESPDGPGSIDLKHMGSGTGTVSSIGLPDDLQQMLTAALRAWADKRLADAEMQLKALGIDLAA